MDPIIDLDAAQAAVAAACAVVDRVREAEFWRLNGNQLLDLGTGLELLGRLVFGAQVALVGEIDTQNVAADHGCVSTAALLRQALVISAPDAKNRVETAKAVLPRDGFSGGEIPPALPLLGDALAAGLIGVEQTRTIVSSMKKIPAHVPDEIRELTQKLLVENGVLVEPKPFADFARSVVEVLTPDGNPPSDEDCAARVELNLGVRNPDTGMTRFHGQLDDIGVEVLSQAIDGLAKPHPAAGGSPGTGTEAIGTGVKDPRSAACRRGQALVEALRRGLDAGVAPIQGGERPHVTVTIGLDELRSGAGFGYMDFGGVIDAGTARMLACDAAIIPAVLGSPSQVLDVGTANRLFPIGIRRAIALRDRGCTFPGCDRPAAWSDCHHIQHWVNNGPSSLANGCLLCPAHHREVHRGNWEVRMGPDGLPEFLPPAWIDRERRPRRNNSHHIATILGR